MRSSLTKTAAAAPTWGASEGHDAALADGQCPDARPSKLEDHRERRGLLRRGVNDLGHSTPDKLKAHVAGAHEGAHPSRQNDLHAHRSADDHRPRDEGLGKRRGWHHQGEHADAPHAGQPRLVRHAQAGRTRKTFEVHRAGKPNAGAGHENPVRERF